MKDNELRMYLGYNTKKYESEKINQIYKHLNDLYKKIELLADALGYDIEQCPNPKYILVEKE